MSRSRTLALALALLLLGSTAAATASTHASPATAQAAPPAKLHLRSQTPWRQGDEPMTLTLDIDAPPSEGLEVAVTLFRGTAGRGLANRSELVQALQGRFPGRGTEVAAVAVNDLPADDSGARTLTFSPTVSRDGVFPVRVDLRPQGGGKAVDSFVTYMVDVPTAPEGSPLDVALVVPVHAPPAVQPDGRSNIDDTRAEQLGRLAQGLERHAGVPFTADITPETAESLATSARNEDRETLASFARIVQGRELLAGPYVTSNLSALTDAGLESEGLAQLTRGVSTLRTLLGAEPALDTRFVDERLSEPALTFLQTLPQPVDHVVLPESVLEPIARNTTLAAPFALDTRHGRTSAAAADTALGDYFTAADPVLGAAELIADLAIVYFDNPGDPRGVFVAAPAEWDPSLPFLDAFLGGLTGNPVLRPVTVGQAFRDVPPEQTPPRRGVTDRTLVRRVTAAPSSSSALPAASLRTTRQRVDAFASAVDVSVPAGAAVIDRIERTVLASEAADLRLRDRTRYLDGAEAQLRRELEAITMPQNRSITLTAREGEIPVTVTRRLDYPVRATLEIESDTLEFPDAATRPLELTRLNTTAQFTVRAQSSGSFPLRVRLTSPEGGLVIAESRFTVRSTAISGVGTALSIGAVLFLLVWWGNHLRGRRSRRLVPSG